MGTPKVYVICDNNCKYEGMTKEQILTAITQAINTGTFENIDGGFISTVKTINGLPLRFFVGKRSDYAALSTDEKNNLFAIITNDTTGEGLSETLEKLREDVDGLKDKLDCSTSTAWQLPESGLYHIRVRIVGDNFAQPAEIQDFGLVKWNEGERITKIGRHTWFDVGTDGTLDITTTDGAVLMDITSLTYEITKIG